MLQEVHQAPERVAEALAHDQPLYADLGRRLRLLSPTVVATVARGSSDHAACYAAYLIACRTGRLVASLPPSLVTVLDAPLEVAGQFVLAISQGGGSPDILRSVQGLRQGGALTVALVNEEGSPLAEAAEFVLPQRAGPELALAATKTVICSMTAIARLVAAWSQDKSLSTALGQLPKSLREAAQAGEAADAGLLKGVEHVYVVARGLGLAAAQEVALKLKETCGLHAEAYSAAEVRHGPREIVDDRFMIIVLALPGSGMDDTLACARELASQGARIFLVAPPGHEPTLALPEGADFRLAPIEALQLIYPWIARSSLALGRNPDRMRNLQSKIVKTV